MKKMHLKSLLLIVLLVSTTTFAQKDSVSSSASLPAHPRLLLLSGAEKKMKNTIEGNPTLLSVHSNILAQCDSMLNKPPVEDIKIGKRLLDKSRECLRRVFFLSYAWRTTRDNKYAERAEKELLAVSAFPDWNPSHFLDVAEMTFAEAIGYDWLYEYLSAEAKGVIAKAITEKGLKPSFDARYNWWLKGSNNWNQVCNSGMVFGALAVYDNNPEFARSVINRALTSVQIPMKEYEPDGAYPEGYNYWGYGTSYNVLMLDALEKIFGTDFGLTANNHFFQTSDFMEHMSGATGEPFNFFDAGKGEDIQPAMFWFAGKRNMPSLLWIEKNHLQ
jgi:hypothetical protein